MHHNHFTVNFPISKHLYTYCRNWLVVNLLSESGRLADCLLEVTAGAS